MLDDYLRVLVKFCDGGNKVLIAGNFLTCTHARGLGAWWGTDQGAKPPELLDFQQIEGCLDSSQCTLSSKLGILLAGSMILTKCYEFLLFV